MDWDVKAAGMCFHDKTGDRHVDFKNERGLRQKKKKFEKSKEDDGDRSNEVLLEESSEVTKERYVATKFECFLKFCYWLNNTGFIPLLWYFYS